MLQRLGRNRTGFAIQLEALINSVTERLNPQVPGSSTGQGAKAPWFVGVISRTPLVRRFYRLFYGERNDTIGRIRG